MNCSQILFLMENSASSSYFLLIGNRGIFLFEELVANRTGITEETVKTVLVGKNPPEKSPDVLCCRCTTKRLFSFLFILRKM